MDNEVSEAEGNDESEVTADEAASDAPSPPRLIEGLQGLDRAQLIIGAFLIAAIGLLAYSGVFRIPFHLDDRQFLVENEALHRLETVSQTWDLQDLRPVTALSLTLNWGLLGESPISIHFVNLLLHLLNGILVFLICRRLIGDDASVAISMAAGMLFVAHPALTQAVNHLPDRGLLLGTSFILLTVFFFLHALRHEGKTNYTSIAISLVCFVLAWGADASAWIVPFLLVLAATAIGRQSTLRERALIFVPYAVLLAGLFVATASGHSGNAPVDPDSLSAFTQARALSSYIAPTFFPVNLQVSYPLYDSELSGLPWRWALLLVLAAFLMRIAPLPGFAILWYLLAIFAQGVYTVDEAFNEARLYLPLAGLVLVIPWCIGIIQAPPIRLVAGFASIAVICGGIYMTMARNAEWRNEIALWASASEACPACYAPGAHLALLYLDQGEETLRPITENRAGLNAGTFREEARGQFALAKTYFELAANSERIDADFWQAYALVHNYLRDPETAAEALKSALRLDPEHHLSLSMLAALKTDRAEATGSSADMRLAIEYLRRAQDVAPLPPAAVVRYANLLARMGDLRGAGFALGTLQESEREQVAPGSLAEIARGVQAAQVLESTIQAKVQEDPADPEILLLNARRLHFEGHYVSSGYLARQALQKSQSVAQAWALLGMNSAKTGSTQQFLLEWPAGPGAEFDADAWQNLARLCASTGEWGGAFDFLQHLAANGESQPSVLAMMAKVALDVGDAQRVGAYYQQAIQQDPGDLAALLGIVDLLLAQDQKNAARQFLARAKANGASEADLKERVARAGIKDIESLDTQRTIIR